jgi:cysteinyl-tRNA synthetase
MAMSVFGPAVDVHAGGTELRFPHHAYHAAMAEAFTGVRPYARAWLHVGDVTIAGAKMAKSAGNLVLLEELLAGHPAAVVRLMILDRPWARNWDYRPELLGAAADRLEDLYQAGGRSTASDPAAVDEMRRLLATELDVPAALDVAIETGGGPALTLASVLGLT